MATRMLAVVDRLQDATGFAPGALLRFYENGTTTPLPVYSDEALTVEFSQPVACDEYGSAPPIYYDGSEPYRVTATTSTGTLLPGFPRDDMVGLPADLTGAGSISFTPSEAVPETTVQDAIEYVGALFTDQTDTQNRAFTPWTTGGTGDAYTVAPSPEVLGYGTFLALRVKFDRVNTGAATINVNGLGTRNIYKMARTGTPGALVAGDIQPGDVLDLTYDGTQFVIVGARTAQGTGYRRYRDGLQICWTRGTLTYVNSFTLAYDWVFPVAFIEAPNVHITLPTSTAGTYTGISNARALGPAYQGGGSSSSTSGFFTQDGAAVLPVNTSVTNVSFTAIGRWF